MRTTKFIAASALAAAAALPAAAQAQSGDLQVSAVHGIPAAALGGNSAVDVYVFAQGGEPGAAPTVEFEFGDVAGPLTIPAGDYTVEVYPDGADTSGDPALSLDATLPAGINATLVAHLDEAGSTPALTPFINDVSNTAAGEARVTVRHTAAAPAVDVLTGDTPLVQALSNPDEASLDTAAGTVPDITVTAAGDPSTVALSLGDVTLAEGTNTIVYAIGSLPDGSITAAVQTIGGLHTAPAAVEAGDAGLADQGMPLALMALMALGALMIVATPAARAVRSRR